MPVELENVSFSYMRGTPWETGALHGLSLRVDDGEFLGVMGHTGCGKTTMLQLMAGLIAPGTGRVLLNGEDINAKGYDRLKLRRGVGVVFQYPEHQLFETTVERDVAFGLKHSGLTGDEIRERVRWALETMDIPFEAVRTESPFALSGGERRRVAIAGVLASKPGILIFDEPTAGLDPLGRQSFLHLLSRLNRSGTTIIVISHDADAMGEYAKRLVVLESGRLVMDGTAAEVFSDIPRMKGLRLGVSAPRLVADMLQKRGFELPQDIVSYDGLLAALKVRLKGGGMP